MSMRQLSSLFRGLIAVILLSSVLTAIAKATEIHQRPELPAAASAPFPAT